jgi:uncharacterized protein (TIGR04222 family)
MNKQDYELFQQIQDYSLDKLEAPLPFSQRLARENGWSPSYAQQVIAEYKKFVFLAVVADHVVTPSDQVDQVWHLHLTYTRSYWQEFCPKILQMPLHHEPSRGGYQEQTKYRQCYEQTLASYELFLGEKPPNIIWPNSQICFGKDLHFSRINTQNYWFIPKISWQFIPLVKRQSLLFLFILLTFSTLVTGCQSLTKIINPLDMAGPEFLAFYFQLSVIIFIVASLLRWLLRLPNSQGKPRYVFLDLYETAYLAGGEWHVIQTVITALTHRGYTTVNRQTSTVFLVANINQLSDSMEMAIAEAIKTENNFSKLRSLSLEPIQCLKEKLTSLELLVSPKEAVKAKLYPSVLIGLLLLLGITKICVGISRDKPVGFLIVFCVLIFWLGIAFLNPVHRSRYGDRILQHLQTVRKDLRTQSYSPDGVALFGVGEPLLADLHVSSSSDGCGGGGCGGGCGG